MEDTNKTTVTKSSVSESEENEASLQRQGKGDLNASDKDERGVSWENVAKENQKKYEKVSARLEETLSRLEELEEKINLTSSEKNEKKNLINKVDDLEKLKRDVLENEENKLWLGVTEDIAQKAKSEARHEIQVELMEDFLEDQAEVLKMNIKDLREELQPYALRHSDKGVLKRAKLAMKDFLEFKKYQKEKEEFKRSKESSESFREEGGREKKSYSNDELIKKGDFDTLLSRI